MYVRAKYNYEASDRAILSFCEGDVIQVLTQLESGWWDGVINGVRGWFPSNYCQVLPSTKNVPEESQQGEHEEEEEEEEEMEEEEMEGEEMEEEEMKEEDSNTEKAGLDF